MNNVWTFKLLYNNKGVTWSIRLKAIRRLDSIRRFEDSGQKQSPGTASLALRSKKVLKYISQCGFRRYGGKSKNVM